MTVEQYRRTLHGISAIVIFLAILAAIGIVLILESKQLAYQYASLKPEPVQPFPVSVDVAQQLIVEDPSFNTFYTDTLAGRIDRDRNWLNQLAMNLMENNWYQNLASPVSRIVVIWPGERKEEVADHLASILYWNQEQQERFLAIMDELPPQLREGMYLPGHYTTHRHATPEEMSRLIGNTYKEQVLARYTPEIEARVPLTDTLIIASMIEREASDFHNMREVSGVIWNRLFIDMPLQLDATLQYARGSNPYEPNWWPKPVPEDKYISSEFNTYQNNGLPPAPIANPSIEAIVAALNPVNTECLFYFHASDKSYHCSETYEQHVQKLRAMYGRGS